MFTCYYTIWHITSICLKQNDNPVQFYIYFLKGTKVSKPCTPKAHSKKWSLFKFRINIDVPATPNKKKVVSLFVFTGGIIIVWLNYAETGPIRISPTRSRKFGQNTMSQCHGSPRPHPNPAYQKGIVSLSYPCLTYCKLCKLQSKKARSPVLLSK